MNRIVQRLIVSLLLGFVASCQAPVPEESPGVFLTIERPTFFDIRHFTSFLPHQGECPCTLPDSTEGDFNWCGPAYSGEVVPPNCKCVIYSEDEFLDLVIYTLHSVGDAEVHSLGIENGMLMMKADRKAVRIVSYLIDAIQQKC